jgi:hypothetical protein
MIRIAKSSPAIDRRKMTVGRHGRIRPAPLRLSCCNVATTRMAGTNPAMTEAVRHPIHASTIRSRLDFLLSRNIFHSVSFTRGASRGRSSSGTGCGARARGSHPRRPGGWGHRPGQLRGSAALTAGRGQDEGWRKPAGSGTLRRPSCPGSTIPSPKIAAMERRKAMRFPFAREAKQNHLRLAALHAPHLFRGATTASLARIARERGRLAVGARCLTIESEKETRGALRPEQGPHPEECPEGVRLEG